MHQQIRNQQLQQEISTLERQLSFLPKLDRQREALNKRLGVISDIQQERNQLTLLLSLLPGIVPQGGVYLDSLSMKSNRISINGIGDSNGRLAILLSNAEQSPWLKDVAMHSIVATKGDKAQDQKRFKASFILAKRPALTPARGTLVSDWQDLDLDEITEWPLMPQCAVALVLALALGGFLGGIGTG